MALILILPVRPPRWGRRFLGQCVKCPKSAAAAVTGQLVVMALIWVVINVAFARDLEIMDILLNFCQYISIIGGWLGACSAWGWFPWVRGPLEPAAGSWGWCTLGLVPPLGVPCGGGVGPGLNQGSTYTCNAAQTATAAGTLMALVLCVCSFSA